ncbi:hypothetical protein [Azotobacter beijerinckii]|uniref:hypothetical protein n=1 Tax=Azotobacter beijerinckii TaxID=170623 RepID=UPI002952E19E|nr:hypothetical protein [Azotobacter beijerinckii]MDV7210970.1 hypothetical protein [Azotobacter beijerinckii]
MNFNNTFCGADPFWANACVGNNGNPGYFEYSKGFSQAANLLINMVLADEGMNLHVDDLIYPVCFNMRHSIELRLKGAIEELCKIAKYKSVRIEFDFATSHDIGIIWDLFKSTSESLDYRFASINSHIEPTIKDIAEIDATGQTFRYPISNESKKHLIDVGVINFSVLRYKFTELEQGFDQLHLLNMHLCDEYHHGTFTSKLNRPQLYRIAMKLPQKSKWVDGGLDPVKAQIRKEYNLSSNDFARALDKIKEHYYLSSAIGAPRPLLGVEEEQIIVFFDCWVKLYPINNAASDIIISGFPAGGTEEMLEDMKRQIRIKSEIWSEISTTVTHGFLAGIRALFYFARDKAYVEYYPVVYNCEMNEAQHLSGDMLKTSFTDILEKTNALRNILISLFAIGHIDLAETLIARLGVVADYIEKSRTRAIFSCPEFADYGGIY